MALSAATQAAFGQQAPPFETRRVADSVHIFRYGGHQAMFVTTPEGVLATGPIAYLRPHAARTYLEENRKVSQAPIRYLVHSHHHYDHIAGGAPFKEAGARVLAHRNAQARLAELENPDLVPADEAVGDEGRVIEMGGTRIELHYVGRNHSDNPLVVLPRERILFTMGFIPTEAAQFRDMPDGCLPDRFDSPDRVLALEWDRMIPGHPYAGGRLGTKEDVRNLKQHTTDLSGAVREVAEAGKCFDAAMREVRLPRYAQWGARAQWGACERYLPGNIERFCEHCGRGY